MNSVSNSEVTTLPSDHPNKDIVVKEQIDDVKPSLTTDLTAGGVWPDLPSDHPLAQLHARLPSLLKESGYDEIYGITLKPQQENIKPDFHTLLILQKFLRANKADVIKAEEQLLKTLIWRKEFQPLQAMKEVHSKDKYQGLGYVTKVKSVDGLRVVTWNIYGAVTDYSKTFLPLDEFLRWRIGLMELGVHNLSLSTATNPIPDYAMGNDDYQLIQVHDYLGVAVLSGMNKLAKEASKNTISLVAAHYPETLSRKFFVNVPVLMQWVYSAMKLVVATETSRKFVVLSYGKDLKAGLGCSEEDSDQVPLSYGGTGPELDQIGEQLSLK